MSRMQVSLSRISYIQNPPSYTELVHIKSVQIADAIRKVEAWQAETEATDEAVSLAQTTEREVIYFLIVKDGIFIPKEMNSVVSTPTGPNVAPTERSVAAGLGLYPIAYGAAVLSSITNHLRRNIKNGSRYDFPV